MCSHRARVSAALQFDEQLRQVLVSAYQQSSYPGVFKLYQPLKNIVAKLTVSFLLLFTPLSNGIETAPSKLIFAVQPSYAEAFAQGRLTDNIVLRLAASMNIEIELYVCPWARCVKAVETGEADIIDDLFFASDRAVNIAYLQPAFEIQDTGFHFFTDRQRALNLTQWQQIKFYRIGVLRGYKHFSKLDDDDSIVKVVLPDIETMVKMTLRNRIDVFVSPPSFDQASIKPFDPEGRIISAPFAFNAPLPLYIGLSKHSKWIEYKDQLEAQLAQIVIPQLHP